MTLAGSQLRSRLAALGRLDDDALGLAEAALLLAALDRNEAGPDPDIGPYLHYLGELGAELARAADGCGDAQAQAACLAEVLSRRHRFRGDDRDDDDLSNINLMSVIDRRCGSADAIGLLALDVARRAGLLAEGLAFPAHFLLRIDDGDGQRAIIDPFSGGLPLGPPELRAMLKAVAGLDAELEPLHYAPLGNRDLLLRLGNSAKLRLLRLGRVERAVELVEALLLLAPAVPLLWREAGLMHMRLDNLSAAIAALEQFVSRTPNAQAKARTLALLAELKRRLH